MIAGTGCIMDGSAVLDKMTSKGQGHNQPKYGKNMATYALTASCRVLSRF